MASGYPPPGGPQPTYYPPIYPHEKGTMSSPSHVPASAAPQKYSPGTVMVAAPRLEPQPWVRDLWQVLTTKTHGTARIDLKRPTPPPLDAYDGNILFTGRPQSAGYQRAAEVQIPQNAPPAVYVPATGQLYPSIPSPQIPHHYPSPVPAPVIVATPPQQAQTSWVPTGARLKVLRHVYPFGVPESGVPLVDVGVGMNLDMDRSDFSAVARVKLRDFVSLRVLPKPMIKLGLLQRLPGSSMALKLRYECPLYNMGDFWRPPARLMLRLDNVAGSGVNLSPMGVDFDEQLLRLGDRLSLRGAATLQFPRQLPIDREDKDAFALKVHRLTVRTTW